MITINLQGGLGNQLFQYALGRALEFRGQKVQFDPTLVRKGCGRIYLLDKLGLQPALGHAEGLQTIHEGSLRFNSEILKVKTDCVLHGYWQSEKYFSDIRGVLVNEITTGFEPSEKTRQIADEIAAAGDRSCFVHIRRTDNLRPAGLTVHGLLNAPDCTYYDTALRMMEQNVPGMKFFAFSDDPLWLHLNYGKREDFRIVDHNPMSGYADERNEIVDREGGTEHEDLWLMSRCRHAIIANSTFSWWGSWLHAEQNDRIVTAPEPWFATKDLDSTDIIPERWLKVAVR